MICFHCEYKKTSITGICPSCYKFPSTVHTAIINISNTLRNISKQLFINGSDILCVEAICDNLNICNISTAKKIYYMNKDLIRNYPIIDNYIIDEVLSIKIL